MDEFNPNPNEEEEKKEDELTKKIRLKEARLLRNAKKYNRAVPKLGQKIHIFHNVDKDGGWQEKYDKNHTNLGRLPHPFRLICSGATGTGKSNTICNIILQHQHGSRKFKKLYVVTCSLQSREWNHMDPEMLMTSLPDPDIFDGKEKCVLCIDDFEMSKINTEEMRKLSTLFRFSSTHRNLSIICSYQNFFEIPQIAKKCANCFLLYKPTSRMDISLIANRIDMDADDLRSIFSTVCSGTYDSLLVNQIPNAPHKLCKNLFEVIEMENDD